MESGGRGENDGIYVGQFGMILDQRLQAISQDSRQSALVAILEAVSQVTYLSATPLSAGESTVKIECPASLPGTTETAWVGAREASLRVPT